jgi:hypothetical protein
MLAGAVARIQDRHGGVLRGKLRAADVRVPQHDCVAVAPERPDRVLQRLALFHTAAVRGDRNDVPATALHRRFERGARARRRLVEKRAEDFPAEDINSPGTLYLQTHLVRKREQIVDVALGELLDRKDMTTMESRVRDDVRK